MMGCCKSHDAFLHRQESKNASLLLQQPSIFPKVVSVSPSSANFCLTLRVLMTAPCCPVQFWTGSNEKEHVRPTQQFAWRVLLCSVHSPSQRLPPSAWFLLPSLFAQYSVWDGGEIDRRGACQLKLGVPALLHHLRAGWETMVLAWSSHMMM